MTDILCNWLNDQLKVSQRVGQATFAREFSSGYLIGEVLNKYQLQNDFDQFSQSRTTDSKLNNFTRLEPVFHLLGIPFDVNVARDVMTEKHGVATRLLYQLYIALNNKKKANLTAVAMETQRPAAPAKLNAIESGIYKERLKHTTPRQTDLNLEHLASHFHEHRMKMEQTAFRERFMESETQFQRRQEQRQMLLERARLLHAKQCEMIAKIRAATLHIPKPPAKSNIFRLQPKEFRHKKEAEETMEAIAKFEEKLRMIMLPTDSGGDEIDVSYITKHDEEAGDNLNLIKISSNDEYIGKIRKRLQEDAAAREEREKRRRKVLGEQMTAHQAQEEARREEMMVNRLMRQSQQERRIAVQLLQIRHEKEVIRNNRVNREQEYQERRLRDFEEALNREAELARLHKEEYHELIRQEQEQHATIAAQRAEERYHRHYDICGDIFSQIVDFACKVAEYRQLTNNLLPAKLMRDWKTLFIGGCDLYEVAPLGAGEPTPEQILEEERQMLLDEGDFMEFQNMVGEWQPSEMLEISGPPRSNPVVGHIIHRLYQLVHPPTPPPSPPEFPPFPIRACVLGKAFSGKTTVVKKLASDHRLIVLDVDELVTEAVNAHKNNEVELIIQEDEMQEIEGGDQPLEDHVAIPEIKGPENPTTLDALTEKHSEGQLQLETMQEPSHSKLTSPQQSKERLEDSNEPQPTVRNQLGGRAFSFLKKGRPIEERVVVDILVHAVKNLPEGTGWVIDGYPRTYSQAKLLEKALSGFDDNAKEMQKETKPKPSKPSLIPDPRPQPTAKEPVSGIDIVILLDIEDDLCLKRANGRTYTVQGDEMYHEEFKPPPTGSATGVGKQEKVVPVTDLAFDQNQIQHRIAAFHDSWSKLEKWFTRFGRLQKVDASDQESAVCLEVEKILEDTLVKLRGEDKETSEPVEQPEETSKVEEVTETVPGAPPEPIPEVIEEISAPGGPEVKSSGAEEMLGTFSGSPTQSTSREGKKEKKKDKDGTSKKDKSERKKSATASSPKSEKGSKESGKKKKIPEPEPEPEPEEPAGPPPPQPGDEEWEFIDLDIEQALASVLSLEWDGVEKTYVNNCKHVFRHLRHERENIYRYCYQIRKDFLAYLQRPDHKQEFVDQWQKDYNAVPDDMRDDEDTHAELHQRVDDLRERLWNISDERKEQAEQERETVINDGWLEDRLGILLNHYITQMQAELDRFQDTLRLLKDYYKAMDGQIPDELNVNYERLPLLDLPMERPEPPETPEKVIVSTEDLLQTTKLESAKSSQIKPQKDQSKSPRDGSKSPHSLPKTPKEGGRKSGTSANKKNKKEKEVVPEAAPPSDGAGLRIKIPLVPRRMTSPDPDGKGGNWQNKDKKDKKFSRKGPGDDGFWAESPMPPNDSDERVLHDAYCFSMSAVGQIMSTEMAAKEAEEEAAQDLQRDKDKGKSGKKSAKNKGKSRSPSPKKGKKEAELSPDEPPEELSEEEKQRRAIRERLRQEYYFAIKEEESATKMRMDLIRAVSIAVVQDLKQKAYGAFHDMNDWLGARFLKEMESIDVLSEVLRHNIENGQMLRERIILQQDNFLVDNDFSVLESPSPPPAPEKVEQEMTEHFTVNQLFRLYNQFSACAPSGIMSSKSFTDTLENIVSVSHGMEQLPDVWMHITSVQIHEISSALATRTDYVDWHRFLLALIWPIPVPSQAQLLDTLHRFQEMDQKSTGWVTREQFDRMDLWFDTESASEDTYNRLSNLKKILFDIFADHRKSLSKLYYVCMLLYFSAVPNSHEGFLRALSVASNTHMPRLKPFSTPAIHVGHDRATSALDSIVECSEEEREAKSPIEPPMTADEIPPEAVDATVPIEALFKVFHHSELASGDSHRFSVSVDPEDVTSMEKLKCIYIELEAEDLEPVMFRVLMEHPVIQDVVAACKTFKALDLKGILSSVAENAELNSNKTD